MGRTKLHGKYDTTTQDKTGQSWGRTGPEGGDLLFPEHTSCTVEGVFVFGLCLDRLHSCLDGIKRHGDIAAIGMINEKGSWFARGITYTVMIPARPPIPKVLIAPSFSPGAA